MVLSPSLLAAGSWALVIGVAALTLAFATIMPERWGWKAFPAALLASLFTAACMTLVFIGTLYSAGGGFVVHFNVLHLAAASALSATAFAALHKRRRARTDG